MNSSALIITAPDGANSNSLAVADIRGLKPLVPIADPLLWLWVTLAALALATVLFYAWHWWKKRRLQALAIPPVPPAERARQKLYAALSWISQPRPFCILVSDTLRAYLEERFEFHAPERTTEEFLHELQSTSLLTAEQKQSLGEFLQACDQVKFARYEPREPELRSLYDCALGLVTETEPFAALATAPVLGTVPA